MQGGILDTSPDLKRHLTEGSMSYFYDTPYYQSESPDEIQHLALEQERIGWHQLLLGKFVKEWRSVQEAYLEATKTPQKIHYHFIHAIWREVRQLWDMIWNEAPRHGKDSKDAQYARQLE